MNSGWRDGDGLCLKRRKASETEHSDYMWLLFHWCFMVFGQFLETLLVDDVHITDIYILGCRFGHFLFFCLFWPLLLSVAICWIVPFPPCFRVWALTSNSLLSPICFSLFLSSSLRTGHKSSASSSFSWSSACSSFGPPAVVWRLEDFEESMVHSSKSIVHSPQLNVLAFKFLGPSKSSEFTVRSP